MEWFVYVGDKELRSLADVLQKQAKVEQDELHVEYSAHKKAGNK